MNMQMNKRLKKVGILGGMGPEASGDIYMKVIKHFYNYAKSDMLGYPHIYINSLPLPNLFQRNKTTTRKYLIEETKKLEALGADILAIACSSAHYYYKDISNSLFNKTILINLIEEIVHTVKNNELESVGIISTELSKPLYKQFFEKENIRSLYLNSDRQLIADQVILSILGGQSYDELAIILNELSNELIKKGATCIVLGCTDLSLIHNKMDVIVPVFSSNDILAKSIFLQSISI
jgi:aspartate racemase